MLNVQVAFLRQSIRPNIGTPRPKGTGSILGLQRDQEDASPNQKMLEVFLAGDSAINIYSLITKQPLDRPMTHDFMYTILEHMASSKCKLQRLARAPLFVHRTVWESVSKVPHNSTIHRLKAEAAEGQTPASTTAQQVPLETPLTVNEQSSIPQEIVSDRVSEGIPVAGAAALSPVSTCFTSLRDDDIEEIKLLKQKLALAVKEEDYRLAMGRHEDAEIFQKILKREVAENNKSAS
eukprot:gene3074-13095_t